MFKKSIKLPIGLGTGPIRKMCPYWPKCVCLEAGLKKIFPEIFPGGPDRIGSSKKFFPEIFPIVGKRRAKLPLRSKSVVFPKKSEYVPVQKNFPEIFSLWGKIAGYSGNFLPPGKNKGFTYLMYIAILYYMPDYYDNYENCEKYLLDHGYTRYKCNVLVIDALFSVMYLKDSDHMEINLLYGKSGEWCNMTCSVNYSGKMGPQFWERIASTYESHAREHFKFRVDNEDFLRLVGDNDYNTVEMAFRRHEMEKSLEVLDGV